MLAHLMLGSTTKTQVCLYFMDIYILLYIYVKHTYQYSDKYIDTSSERLHATHIARESKP